MGNKRKKIRTRKLRSGDLLKRTVTEMLKELKTNTPTLYANATNVKSGFKIKFDDILFEAELVIKVVEPEIPTEDGKPVALLPPPDKMLPLMSEGKLVTEDKVEGVDTGG